MRPCHSCVCAHHNLLYPRWASAQRLQGPLPGCSDRVRAEAGDACALPASLQPAAGIFSMFGLQQLPDPHVALATWVHALMPGEGFQAKTCTSCACAGPDSSAACPLDVHPNAMMPVRALGSGLCALHRR